MSDYILRLTCARVLTVDCFTHVLNFANMTDAFQVEYFHACVLDKVESWPDDLLADYARIVANERGEEMPELKFQPIPHDHSRFLANANKRPGFSKAYDALDLEYQLANEMLKARSRAGLTQDAVAERMGTTKSAVSRLEGSGKHAPSLSSLKRYAQAVGCDLQIRFVRRRAP